jgi:hypothetical protein
VAGNSHKDNSNNHSTIRILISEPDDEGHVASNAVEEAEGNPVIENKALTSLGRKRKKWSGMRAKVANWAIRECASYSVIHNDDDSSRW